MSCPCNKKVEMEVPDHSFSNSSSQLEFRFEAEANKIIPVLQRRLPKSANIYNMCRIYDTFQKPQEMAFYVMNISSKHEENGCDQDSAWILATYFREDFGMRYATCAPTNADITENIKEAFLKCPYIDWKNAYSFMCTDTEICPLIYEISSQLGNKITTIPCRIFYLDTHLAANLEIPPVSDSPLNKMKLLSLNSQKGVEFLYNNWPFSVPGKTNIAMGKLFSKFKSMGLYDERAEKFVCGVCINDCGLMGSLFTLPEHRGKGYATLVFKQLMKLFAQDCDATPCSGVEVENYISIAFHEKLGMSVSHHANILKYVPV